MAIFYEKGMTADLDGPILSKSILNPIKIIQTSDTSIEITVETMNMSDDPSYYVVTYKEKTAAFPTTLNPNPTSNTFNITGLQRAGVYTLNITAYFADDSDKEKTAYSTTYTMDEEIAGGTVLGNVTDPYSIKNNSNGGYLTLSSKITDDKKYTVATREFDAIILPSSTEEFLSGGKNKAKKYTESYYAFGTSMIFSAAVDNGKSGGGIGFFTDERANVGYYLVLDTTVSAGSNSKKAVKWVKIGSGKNTTETLASTTEAGIIAGETYNIDIRVKIKDFNITMTAFINGAQLTASDKTYYDTATKKVKYIVQPTAKIALFCTQGKIFFDYVYGKQVDAKYYADAARIVNRYYGKYSNDLINTSFGELNFLETEVDAGNGKEYIDEFGNTVREIRKYSVDYGSNAPAQPITWDNSTQPAVAILAQDWNNFSSNVWILNNASTTVALSNRSDVTFNLFGNPIAETSALEYNTGDESDYAIRKPAIFETAWVQRSEDAKALGDWIKGNLINQGKIVTMSIFGNPLIQLGDIVSIKHAYQKFDGTQSLIVTNITHSYSNGLRTEIVCRTI